MDTHYETESLCEMTSLPNTPQEVKTDHDLISALTAAVIERCRTTADYDTMDDVAATYATHYDMSPEDVTAALQDALPGIDTDPVREFLCTIYGDDVATPDLIASAVEDFYPSWFEDHPDNDERAERMAGLIVDPLDVELSKIPDPQIREHAKSRVMKLRGNAEGDRIFRALEPTPQRLADLESAFLDIDDLDTLPTSEPMIDGWIDRGSLNILYAKFGAYKSFLAITWAAHIATGRNWGDCKVPTQHPVLYVAAEGTYNGGYPKRLQAWQAAHGKIDRGQFSTLAKPVDLLNPLDIDFLRQKIVETGSMFVVIDTLHRCTPGADEQSNNAMGSAIAALDALRHETGAAFLVIHHPGKTGNGPRGASALEDDIEASFMIELSGESRAAGNPRTLVNRKVKDAALSARVPLRLVIDDEIDSGFVEADGTVRASERSVESLAALALAHDIPRDYGSARLTQAMADLADVALTVREAKQLAAFRKQDHSPVTEVTK